jgi:hypothetical protein
MKPYTLVVIDWVDSSSTGKPWRGIDDFGSEAQKPLQCRTAGYLMASTKKAVTLAMNLAYEPGCNPHSAGNDMTIPRCSILKIHHVLREFSCPKS